MSQNQRNLTDEQRLICAEKILEGMGLSVSEMKVHRHTSYSASRKRMRISIEYRVCSITSSTCKEWLCFEGRRFQNMWDDLTRKTGRSCAPSLKSMLKEDLKGYFYCLCAKIDVEYINSRYEKQRHIIDFIIRGGRYAGFRGSLDKNALLDKINSENPEIGDPRTLLDDQERLGWLSKYLDDYGYKLLSGEWPGGRGRCLYECPEGHINSPIMTNLLRSSNQYSCSECHDQPVQARRIIRDRKFAEQEVSFYLVKTLVHPENNKPHGDGYCKCDSPRMPSNMAAKIGFTHHLNPLNRSNKYLEIITSIRCPRAVAAAAENRFLSNFCKYSLAEILRQEGHRDDGYTEMLDISLANQPQACSFMKKMAHDFSDIEVALTFLREQIDI